MEQKWTDLSECLRMAGVYSGHRLLPEILAGAYHLNRAVTREVGGSIVAYAALWSTHSPHWRELGTVYVAKEHSGNGLMRGVVDELITTRALPDEQLFFITRESRVMRIAKWHSFELVTNSPRGVLKWASQVGIVQRLPESVHGKKVKPEAGDRWLFVRGKIE